MKKLFGFNLDDAVEEKTAVASTPEESKGPNPLSSLLTQIKQSKGQKKYLNDRINDSASEDSQGMKLNLSRKEYAAEEGAWEIGDYMAKKDLYTVDVTSVDIFSLARHGRLKELRQVLEHGVDPNSKDRHGNTILIVGAQNGNKALVKLALRHGGLLNMTNCCGNSALHFAAEYRYEMLESYLLRKGANPDIQNMNGFKAAEGLNGKQPPEHIVEHGSDDVKLGIQPNESGGVIFQQINKMAT